MDRREPDIQPPARLTAADRAGEGALVELWRQSRRWLAAILYAHKPRDADLEDLMQDVAMKLVQHRHELADPRDPAAVRPWLRTVAINVARSAGRRTRTRAAAAHDLQYEAAIRVRDSQSAAQAGGESSRARGARALEVA